MDRRTLRRHMGETLDSKQIGQIARLTDYTLDPHTFASVQEWVSRCYNSPSSDELIMCAIDEVMGGYGVEALRVEGDYVDSYHGDMTATFVNMGDTYDSTILLDSRSGRFVCCSWGDWTEFIEAKLGGFNGA